MVETENAESKDGGSTWTAKAAEEPMLKYFSYEHLREPLRSVSKPFYELAETIAATLPSNAQRDLALQKLVEAKDCAVRAALP